MINELLARATPFKVELATQFRSVNHRIGFIIEGEHGFGEWAPFSDYKPNAAAKWLAAALEAADQPKLPVKRTAVPVNGIVPALKSDLAADWAEKLVRESEVSTLKIKVGDIDEFARVKSISDRLPGVELRVDANGKYSPAQAKELIPRFADLGVSVIEQPCAELKDFHGLKGRGLLIAVDESIRLSEAITSELIDELNNLADIAVLKPIPLGGSSPTLNLADKLNMPIIVSGSLDTSIGLSFVNYVAALLPQEPLPSGLGTSVLFAEDLTNESLTPRNGVLRVGAIEPDATKLEIARSKVNAAELSELTDRFIAAATALQEHSGVFL